MTQEFVGPTALVTGAAFGIGAAVALRLGREGAAVAVDTPLLSANLDAGTLGTLTGRHPIGRQGRAEEAAELTCFLLSDRACFVTGSYHLVDGAYTAQ